MFWQVGCLVFFWEEVGVSLLLLILSPLGFPSWARCYPPMQAWGEQIQCVTAASKEKSCYGKALPVSGQDDDSCR